MNRIKIVSILFIFVLYTSCSKDDYKLGSETTPFLRFNFLTRSDNTPLEYPIVNAGLTPQSHYVNNSIKTLKVPVALTSRRPLKNSVTANFSAVSSNNDSESFTINPINELIFEGNKLTDTIFVSFDKRWTENQSITLKLETVSDPEIHIGNLNTEFPNDIFKIDLEEITTNYTFPINLINIKGEVGEKFDFKVDFPNGYFPSELENIQIFKFQNGFEYSLSHDDFEINKNTVTYHFTLLENIQNDDVRYESKITLANVPNYTATGNTSFRIVKPEKTLRDVQANPAAKFSDLAVPFYLTYLEQWFDKSGVCTWQPSTTLTFPVRVSKDDVNAIQYSGQNTPDTADDIYLDAFKIGFNVASGTNTVNSFGLKRWFANESGSAAFSPGFNITSALEFFPENGNSKTKGTVIVIPQDLIIAPIEKDSNGKDKPAHVIEISGEGTYSEISNGLFEISFEIKTNK